MRSGVPEGWDVRCVGDVVQLVRRLVVRTMRLLVFALIAASTSAPDTPVETKPAASDEGEADWFGHSVAISGETLVL